MNKFTLICEYIGDTIDSRKIKNTMEFEAVTLDEVVPQLESFLRGSGYYFEGLEVVDEK